MDYNLAKKLKDAGFPQKEPNMEGIMSEVFEFSKPYQGHGVTGGKYYVPTLSELIEACGRELRLQNSNPSLWQADNCGDFNQWDKDRYIYGVGLIPEEAVANLWLELNGFRKDSGISEDSKAKE